MILDFNGLYFYLTVHRKPLALACGCFDLLTLGHIRHLKAIRRLGRTLCVLVTADEHISKPGRPILPENDRAEMVDALRCVDFTVINRYPTAVQAILRFKPQVYAKGKEYRMHRTERLDQEVEALNSIGGRLEFTDTDEMHTSDIVERLATCR